MALRTLRQIPKAVGETPSGDLIFEIQSVRLILGAGAGHFSRLVDCAGCGMEAPGPSVQSMSDLGQSAHAVICKDCVKAGSATSAYRREAAPLEARARVAAPENQSSLGQAERRPVDDPRLGALERCMAELLTMLKEQRTNLESALDDRMGSTQGELASLRGHAEQLARAQQDVNDVLEGIIGKLDRSTVADAALVALESRIGEAMTSLVERVEIQHADLRTALDDRVEQLQSALSAEVERATGAVDLAVTGNIDLREAQLEIGRRLEGITARLAQEPGTGGEDLQALGARLQQLEGDLAPGKLTSAAAELVNGQLRSVEEELRQRLDQLEQRVAQSAESDRVRASSLERRIEEMLDRLSERAEAQSELRVTLEGRVEQLQAVLARQAGEADAGLARFTSESRALGQAQESFGQRFDQVVQRVEQLQVSVVSETTRAQSESVALAGTNAAELARIDEQINARFDRLVERAARTNALEVERVQSLEVHLQEAVARIAEAIESNRRELQAGLVSGLAEVRSAIPPPAKVSDSRVQALEERVQQNDDEVSELGELQAVLDVGMGVLRSEIAEVRSAVARLAGDNAEIMDRLADLDRVPKGEETDRLWGRGMTRDTVAGATPAATVDNMRMLAREHQQLKAQVSELEQSAEAAKAAAARASSQASAASPLRIAVRRLERQLAAQDEALVTLNGAVERLRRKVSAPAPPAKPPLKAAKG